MKNPGDKFVRAWHFVNAEGHIVGRLATQIAQVLLGKHKPFYKHSKDYGDWVVITNAEKAVLTGKKWEQKVYYWHTGWPGGLKKEKVNDMLRDHPERILRRAIMGMMPKNRIRTMACKRLRIFAGPDHPHHAQMALSPSQQYVQFDQSKWREMTADPTLHRGYLMRLRDTPEALDIEYQKGPGKKRAPRMMKLMKPKHVLHKEKRQKWRDDFNKYLQERKANEAAAAPAQKAVDAAKAATQK